MSKPHNIHGTALLLGTHGVRLRGPSGAGKSVLALSLLDRWEGRGLEALLVADDRVDLSLEAGELLMSPPPNLAGLIELRGRGIIKRPYRSAVRLDLVIDLVPELIRMLEDDELQTVIESVTLARAPVPVAGVVNVWHQMLLVSEAMAALAQS
jgi:serine kinase of HPr protein (carbohydrate metabolism regulator)